MTSKAQGSLQGDLQGSTAGKAQSQLSNAAQGKVSLVIPCYNKEHLIGSMFDSVLAQTWNTVELILVNDGSTDATGNIIASYAPRFEERGYEVCIIDQGNSGVCAAAKTGLQAASGDYICLVDADDELDCAYVSTMASWLDAHPDCDHVICSAVNFTESPTGRHYFFWPAEKLPHGFDDSKLAPEHFLMGEVVRQTVWVHMVRAGFLARCQIIENYHTALRGSHELGFCIPLLAYPAKRKYFPLPLYACNQTGEGFSRAANMEPLQSYYDSYTELCDIAVDSLPNEVESASRKRFLKKVMRLSAALRLYLLTRRIDAPQEVVENYAHALVDIVNSVYMLDQPLTREQINGKEALLTKAIHNALFDHLEEEELEAFPWIIEATTRIRG